MRRPLAALALLALAGLAAGCFNPFDPLVSTQRAVSSPAPPPSSPTGAVQLFVWCWQHRDPNRYAEIFTDDYRFIFSPTDSAGNGFRDRPWLREDELLSAQHLFVGGADQPPASDIQITTDRMQAEPDPRPGHQNRWHWTITTYVNLKVTVTGPDGTPSVTPVQGNALFYLVRGDSAVIPPELVTRGFRPDSSRWWIDRWEDQTVGTSPASARRPGATPARVLMPISWGQLKALYLPSSTY